MSIFVQPVIELVLAYTVCFVWQNISPITTCFLHSHSVQDVFRILKLFENSKYYYAPVNLLTFKNFLRKLYGQLGENNNIYGYGRDVYVCIRVCYSGCSGFVSAVLGTPADVVKTRFMNQPLDNQGRY